MEKAADDKWNEENELIVERLGAALKKLKKTSQTLEQWHAYQTILTAIAPDTSDSAGCDAGAYQAMLKKRFKIYKNVADSAADRRLAIDVDDPSAVWCLAKKKAYRNKLSLKHPDAFLKGAAVWDSETQASANECDVIVDHDMHRGNHEWQDVNGRKKRRCKGGTCSTHVRHHLLGTERAIYEIYLLRAAADSDAFVLSFHQFRGCKPYYVTKPDRKTCMCVYHQKINLAMDEYRRLSKEWHKSCDCSCALCIKR